LLEPPRPDLPRWPRVLLVAPCRSPDGGACAGRSRSRCFVGAGRSAFFTPSRRGLDGDQSAGTQFDDFWCQPPNFQLIKECAGDAMSVAKFINGHRQRRQRRHAAFFLRLVGGHRSALSSVISYGPSWTLTEGLQFICDKTLPVRTKPCQSGFCQK